MALMFRPPDAQLVQSISILNANLFLEDLIMRPLNILFRIFFLELVSREDETDQNNLYK